MIRAGWTHSREVLLLPLLGLLLRGPLVWPLETGSWPGWGQRPIPTESRETADSPCVLHRRAQVLFQSLQEEWQIPSWWGLKAVPCRTNPISLSPNASETSWRWEIKCLNSAVHWSPCGCTKLKIIIIIKKSSGTFPSRTHRDASGLSWIRIRPLPLTISLYHIFLFATVWLHTDKHWKETVESNVVMPHLANVCRGRNLYKCHTHL